MEMMDMIKSGFSQFEDKYPGFEQNKAYIAVLDKENKLGKEIGGEDIYDLLDRFSVLFESFTDEQKENVSAVALSTSGWAASMESVENQGLAPSQAPDRRRVRLVACATKDGFMASAMRLQGDEEVIYDFDTAHGPLADALRGALGV